MKLYYSKGACSLAVRIIINELNLSCDFVSVNLKTKQTEFEEDFLKINPKGSVPVLLTDENEILTENAVIQQYLAEKNKNTELLPPSQDFKHYRVLEWLNFITTELHKGVAPFFNPSIPKDIKENVFLKIVKGKIQFVEKQLNQKTYLLGDTFTLPDAYLFVILTWLHNFKIQIEEWPNLSRYFKDLKKRNSIKKSLEEEGLGD